MTWFNTLRELINGPKKETCMCMLVSEQEGAEIWLNGKKTDYLTPRLLTIPRGQEVEVELRLHGHRPHKAHIRSPHNLTYYYCTLERIPLRLVRDEIHTATAL
jgi:hypothetical protein